MPSFDTVSKEIESLLDHTLFCQTPNLDQRRREVALFDARLKIAEKIFRFIEAKGDDYTNKRWQNRVDSVVIMTLLDECLRNYQKMKDASFFRMFMSRYARRVPDPRKTPVEKIDSIDGNIKGQRILEKLHEVADKAGIDPKESSAEIKKLNQQNRLSPNRICEILKLFHQSPDAINAFIDEYLNSSIVDSFNRFIDENDDNSSITLVNTIAAAETDTYDQGMNTELFEVAMKIAKERKHGYENYMRYTLTFLAIEHQAYSIDLEPFLDMEYYNAHKNDNYLVQYYQAAAEAKAAGKTIRQESFINNCRMKDFASDLKIQPDTWRKKFKDCCNMLAKAGKQVNLYTKK